MKNALAYQMTEFDCGPTTVTNAIRFLFDREEIPPALLKGIWLYCNDTYNEQGELGKRGTSKASIHFLASWLTDYGKGTRFPLLAECVDGADADIRPGSRTLQCLAEGGAALMRCWIEEYGHYVLLTSIENEGELGLFDPYDEPDELVVKVDGMQIIHDQPLRLNRIVPISRLNSHEKLDYAMGDDDLRVNLLFWRTAAEKVSQTAAGATKTEKK